MREDMICILDQRDKLVSLNNKLWSELLEKQSKIDVLNRKLAESQETKIHLLSEE